jgi:Xaa-Pro aminopeptidase
MKTDYAPYIERRAKLLKRIEQNYQEKPGVLVLFAGFEQKQFAFLQESNFYYLTGLEEPATVLVVDHAHTATLWVPQYGIARSLWTSTLVEADKAQAAQWGIQDIRHLGHPCKGYTAGPVCTASEYEHLIASLKALVSKGNALFMIYPPNTVTEQTLMIDRLFAPHKELQEAIIDISPLLGMMRRTKSRDELESMYSAVDCTMAAQESAAVRIEEGLYEYQLQAAVEFIFKEGGGSPAFPTIVASGKNSTTLHYTRNDGILKRGALVVVDCGARLEYYCADLTRTYPISGSFTDRQRQVYDVVLETQQFVAERAQPGMWISNPTKPEQSLHHLALKFLEAKGYAQYLTHSIGHFIGLDVHDVGAELGPLQEGDVIALEPGIYIPQEQIGIRIEDMYWITQEGAVCISEELPRDSYEIEDLMCGELEEEI